MSCWGKGEGRAIERVLGPPELSQYPLRITHLAVFRSLSAVPNNPNAPAHPSAHVVPREQKAGNDAFEKAMLLLFPKQGSTIPLHPSAAQAVCMFSDKYCVNILSMR